ncbi:Uncharacterised protein g9348 [Pycnogonum litorale]
MKISLLIGFILIISSAKVAEGRTVPEICDRSCAPHYANCPFRCIFPNGSLCKLKCNVYKSICETLCRISLFSPGFPPTIPPISTDSGNTTVNTTASP